MKRISVAHRFKDRALVASLVRGIAFALITLSSRVSYGAFTSASH